jgi:hypothetical protein
MKTNQNLINKLKENNINLKEDEHLEIKNNPFSVIISQHPESMMDWLIPAKFLDKNIVHYFLPKYQFP